MVHTQTHKLRTKDELSKSFDSPRSRDWFFVFHSTFRSQRPHTSFRSFRFLFFPFFIFVSFDLFFPIPREKAKCTANKMNHSNSFLFLTLICSFGCAFVAATIPVPAMMWKPEVDGKVLSRSVPAMVIQTKPEFQQIINEASDEWKRLVVVLLRDSLSTEDFKCQENGVTCHKNLVQMKNKKYVPAIDDAYTALMQMNKTALIAYVETTDELSQTIGNEQIVFVNLPTRFMDETPEQYNARVDRVIGALAEKLDDKHPLYVLTGKQSDPHHATLSRKRRDVAAAAAAQRAPAVEVKAAQTLKNPNLLVYFTGLTVYKRGENHTVDPATLSVSDVTSNSLKAELKGSDVTVAFAVYDFGSTWVLQDITVNGAKGSPTKRVSAPLGFSYKCTPVVNITVIDGDVVAVGVRGLQIQPKFGDVSSSPLTRFGDANDCTGFTSIGIWSGLIVSFLLLGIMTLGLSWILDIRTMDRFDDPKGACANSIGCLVSLFILSLSIHSQEKLLQSQPPTKPNKIVPVDV